MIFAHSRLLFILILAAVGLAISDDCTEPTFTATPSSSATENNNERTFIAVKPDGVQRGLTGEIISRFHRRGYKLVALKMVHPTIEQAQTHYIDLAFKPFYPSLCQYLSSGPIVGMVWEGLNVIKSGRLMLGATNPVDSLPGTIRGDFAISVGRNVCHGSDSTESASREIALWFETQELMNYESLSDKLSHE